MYYTFRKSRLQAVEVLRPYMLASCTYAPAGMWQSEDSSMTMWLPVTELLPSVPSPGPEPSTRTSRHQQGAPPPPQGRPPAESRTLGLSARLRRVWTPARLSPTPGCLGPGENCVTRRERSGHLRLLGTSAERVWAEEERCASAPTTAPGNSHLTGEASPPPPPEVWCLCRGRRRSRQKQLSVSGYPDVSARGLRADAGRAAGR